MKVLFLDVDGVLNCADTHEKYPESVFPIDKYKAFLIGKIQLDTGCEVVLSSTWRHSSEAIEQISKRVVPIFDKTPNNPIGVRERGYEIKAWLDQHQDVVRYAILDDDDDMLSDQLPNFFKTSWENGITEEIAMQVTKHLNTE